MRCTTLWEYYLVVSEAGFDSGVCQDLQIVLEKGRAMRPRSDAGEPVIGLPRESSAA